MKPLLTSILLAVLVSVTAVAAQVPFGWTQADTNGVCLTNIFQ